MAGGRYESPDEFLEAADRCASLGKELGGRVKDMEPVRRAARREQPQ